MEGLSPFLAEKLIQGEDHEDEILTKKILMTRKTRWKTRRKTLTQTEDLAADPTGDPDHVPSFDLTEKIKPTMWLIMEAGQASEVEDIEDNFVAAETKVAKTKVVKTSSMTRQVIEDNVVAAETKVAKTKVVETSSMTRQIIEDNGAETKVVETSSMTEDRAENLDQRFWRPDLRPRKILTDLFEDPKPGGEGRRRWCWRS